MNKTTTIEAILKSDLYSNSEKKILIELVKISIDLVAVSSVKSLKEKTGLSTTTTYTSLNSLKRRGVVILNSYERNSYTLNEKEILRLLSSATDV